MSRYDYVYVLEEYKFKFFISTIFVHAFKFHQLAPYVLMAMFVLLEAPISMRVEWRCVSITSGEQFVTTSGIALMLLLSVNNWDMLTLEVSSFYVS